MSQVIFRLRNWYILLLLNFAPSIQFCVLHVLLYSSSVSCHLFILIWLKQIRVFLLNHSSVSCHCGWHILPFCYADLQPGIAFDPWLYSNHFIHFVKPANSSSIYIYFFFFPNWVSGQLGHASWCWIISFQSCMYSLHMGVSTVQELYVDFTRTYDLFFTLTFLH